jgi:uncharacterized protein (DUF58 family)
LETSHTLLKRVKRIEITTRKLVEQLLGGEYRSAFRGRGVEFTEHRTYQEGDDPRHIDWNVTARTGIPHVKVFTEERELQVVILVDLSGSLKFGSVSLTKHERTAEAAALLALAAVRTGDRVGFLSFAEDVIDYIPPDKGRNHALAVVHRILGSTGVQKPADISRALSFLGRLLHRKALLFVISDFRFSGGTTLLKAAARRHDLVGVHVFDPREFNVPSVGLIRFSDPETGLVRTVDTGSPSWRSAFAANVARTKAAREALVKSCGFDLVSISTTDDLVLPLRRFFELRRRRGRH